MNKTAIGIVVIVAAALLIWGVSGSTEKVADLGEGAMDIVKNAGNAVVDGADAVVDGAEGAVDAVVDGADAVVDSAEGAVDAVVDGANAVVDGAEGAVDAVADSAQEIADSMDLNDDIPSADGTYDVDTSTSTLMRKGATPLKSHYGDVQITSGEVTIKDGMVTAGAFEIDMTTIDTIDLKEDEVDGMDEHLYGEDFFDVENYPTAMLEITDVTDGMVNADLTIKDQTHPITFEIDIDGNTAMTSFTIDRTVRGITYSSTSLIDTIKDKAINDDIEFDVTLMW